MYHFKSKLTNWAHKKSSFGVGDDQQNCSKDYLSETQAFWACLII
jgi:hypothetical protein